jgi:hypothetical protein
MDSNFRFRVPWSAALFATSPPTLGWRQFHNLRDRIESSSQDLAVIHRIAYRHAGQQLTPCDYAMSRRLRSGSRLRRGLQFHLSARAVWLGEERAESKTSDPRPRFALTGACPKFPILRNSEETICRRCKTAQLRHSAYCSHPQRAMRYSRSPRNNSSPVP